MENKENKENKSTTIKISETTKERLEHLREHKEESSDSLINKALNILNVCMRSPSLAAKILKDVESSKKRKELLENPDKMIKKKSLAEKIIKRASD
jgi:predicted DNA-binding protein